jgi:hypothetical protein
MRWMILEYLWGKLWISKRPHHLGSLREGLGTLLISWNCFILPFFTPTKRHLGVATINSSGSVHNGDVLRYQR